MLQNRLKGLSYTQSTAASPTYPIPEIPSHTASFRSPWRRLASLFPSIFRIGPLVFAVMIGAAWEGLAPTDWKISDWTGGFLGHEKLVATATELNAIKSAAAAQADAAIHAQQMVEQFRAQNERLTHACQALYQQVGSLNSVIANTQQEYVAKRQELLASTMAGDVAMANLNQISPLYGRALNALNGALGGDPHEARRTQRTPQQILDQYDRSMQLGLEKAMANIRRWQPGIGTMATIDTMVPSDCVTRPEVQPPVTAPAPPARYQRPANAGHG